MNSLWKTVYSALSPEERHARAVIKAARERICAAAADHNYSLDVNQVIGEGAFSVVLPITPKRYNSAPTALPMVAKVGSTLIKHAYSYNTIDEESYEQTFVQEINALRSVGYHPNIIRMIDHFVSEQNVQLFESARLTRSFFIVMERANMSTLKQYVNVNGVFEDSAFRAMASGLIDAVNYIHARDLCHGDIKPSNVLMHQAPRNIILKLADFGFATHTSQKASFCGSLVTMSPEAFRNKFIMMMTFQPQLTLNYQMKLADIYSVGATIYYALIGDYPIWKTNNVKNDFRVMRDMFCTGDIVEKKAKIYFARVEKWYTKPSDKLSCECREALQAMLQVDPSKRTQTLDCEIVFNWTRSNASQLALDSQENPSLEVNPLENLHTSNINENHRCVTA